MGNGTTAISQVGPAASTGAFLASNGVGSDPGFSTATYPLTTTAFQLLVSTAANTVGGLTAGTTGTVLTGVTGAVPTFSATPAVTSITFGAGSALNTYVVGTFTPSLDFGGLSVGITYSAQLGKYTQIGNIVYFSIQITLTSKGISTGTANITGFPVVVVNANPPSNAMVQVFQGITIVGDTQLAIALTTGATAGTFLASGTGVSATQLSDTNFTNTSLIQCNGFYFTS